MGAHGDAYGREVVFGDPLERAAVIPVPGERRLHSRSARSAEPEKVRDVHF
jgi:hypothetical protein